MKTRITRRGAAGLAVLAAALPGRFSSVFSAVFDLSESPSYPWVLNGFILTTDPTVRGVGESRNVVLSRRRPVRRRRISRAVRLGRSFAPGSAASLRMTVSQQDPARSLHRDTLATKW